MSILNIIQNYWFKIPSLTHFSPGSHSYTPWKRQKTSGFLAFSGGIEMWHWTKMGYVEVDGVWRLLNCYFSSSNTIKYCLSFHRRINRFSIGFLNFLKVRFGEGLLAYQPSFISSPFFPAQLKNMKIKIPAKNWFQ